MTDMILKIDQDHWRRHSSIGDNIVFISGLWEPCDYLVSFLR